MPVKQLLNALMEACIIHDDDTFFLKLWYQRDLAPVIENFFIDICLQAIECKQRFAKERTNDVGSIFSLPVITVNARATNRRIAITAYRLTFKATLIHVYNGKALSNVVVKLA